MRDLCAMPITCDIAVIGGGPAACTLGTLLKKYNPELDVVLLEREVFPRDHVGESQIPHLMHVLHEMNVWDKVEAANFPIKIGGRYKWGNTDDLWSLDFIPPQYFQDEQRPAKFAGQRVATAFQVDRSIYDKILLDHARESGCRVFEGVKVANVNKEGDRVTGFDVVATDPKGVAALGDEATVHARWYVDASGNSGLLRRTMDVDIDSPTALRNIAVYDYWQNTEWAERIGTGGTRILTLSLDCGWLWFIPLGPTRTSLGLVIPADHVKKTGKRPEELYAEAVASEPTIAQLTANATREHITQTAKDWSFVSKRLFGENWFLAGDAAGFADPILSAGLTLAQTGSRNLAYTLLELDKGETDPQWIKQSYETTQTARIRNHIRFADFWYSVNGHFTDLKEHCAEIARCAGVKVTPEEAFVWMGSGGFANDDAGLPGAGAFSISGLKQNIRVLTGKVPRWEVTRFNKFRLNVDGATRETVASYSDGRVRQIPCYKRDHFVLPDHLSYGAMLAALQHETDLDTLMERYIYQAHQRGLKMDYEGSFRFGLEILEAMLTEGWVIGETASEGRYVGMLILPDSPIHVIGWVKDGVGLTSVNPRFVGKVVLPWDEMQAALKSA